MREGPRARQSLSESFDRPAAHPAASGEVSRIPGSGCGVSRPGPPRSRHSRTPIASIGRARSATDVATPIATIPSAAAPAMIPK